MNTDTLFSLSTLYKTFPMGHTKRGTHWLRCLLQTKPYNFGYSVKDFNQGTDFKQQETSDGNTVKGQYRVQLPDGRLQIVTYTADWQTGQSSINLNGIKKFIEK